MRVLKRAVSKDIAALTIDKKALFCTVLKVTLSTERIQTKPGALK